MPGGTHNGKAVLDHEHLESIYPPAPVPAILPSSASPAENFRALLRALWGYSFRRRASLTLGLHMESVGRICRGEAGISRAVAERLRSRIKSRLYERELELQEFERVAAEIVARERASLKWARAHLAEVEAHAGRYFAGARDPGTGRFLKRTDVIPSSRVRAEKT